MFIRHVGPLLGLVIPGLLLQGCGGPSAFFLMGGVVNAAGTAIMEAKPTTEGYTPHRIAWDEQLRRYAEDGNVDAQYELGLIHMKRHEPEAYVWLCRAAHNNHAGAQLLLGHIYNQDRAEVDLWPFIRVDLDNRVSYVWYSLAKSNGAADAGLFLANLSESHMQPQDIAAAQRRLTGSPPGAC